MCGYCVIICLIDRIVSTLMSVFIRSLSISDIVMNHLKFYWDIFSRCSENYLKNRNKL